jgi:hypothetical protein
MLMFFCLCATKAEVILHNLNPVYSKFQAVGKKKTFGHSWQSSFFQNTGVIRFAAGFERVAMGCSDWRFDLQDSRGSSSGLGCYIKLQPALANSLQRRGCGLSRNLNFCASYGGIRLSRHFATVPQLVVAIDVAVVDEPGPAPGGV